VRRAWRSSSARARHRRAHDLGSPALPAAAILAHHDRALDGFGAYAGGRPCAVCVKEAADIAS
jgi:hypothetical protein